MNAILKRRVIVNYPEENHIRIGQNIINGPYVFDMWNNNPNFVPGKIDGTNTNLPVGWALGVGDKWATYNFLKNTSSQQNVLFEINSQYTIELYDSWGDGFNGNVFQLTAPTGYEFTNITIGTGTVYKNGYTWGWTTNVLLNAYSANTNTNLDASYITGNISPKNELYFTIKNNLYARISFMVQQVPSQTLTTLTKDGLKFHDGSGNVKLFITTDDNVDVSNKNKIVFPTNFDTTINESHFLTISKIAGDNNPKIRFTKASSIQGISNGISDNLSISGTTHLSGPITGYNNLSISGTTHLSGPITGYDNLSISFTHTTGTLHVNGNCVISGSLIVHKLNTSSDIRYKTEIKEIENALKSIKCIRGVTYKFKSNPNPEYGVIAQEIEKVFPYLVETDSNGYKCVDYSRICAILINSQKEMITKFEQLECRLDSLINSIKN